MMGIDDTKEHLEKELDTASREILCLTRELAEAKAKADYEKSRADGLFEQGQFIKEIAIEEAAKVADKVALEQAVKRDKEKFTTASWQIYNQGIFIADGLSAAIRALVRP
jgi:hypothetical protein